MRGLDAPLAPVQAQGGGRPTPPPRRSSPSRRNPSTLSLGRPGDDGVAHGKLTVENLTDAARTLSLGVQRDAAGDATGLTAAISPARFVLAPHAVATLPVSVRLRPRRAPSAWPAAGSSSRPTPAPPSTCRWPSRCRAPGWCRSAPPRCAAGVQAGAKATLSLALGSAAAPGDGSVQLAAVRQLTLELYRGEKRLAALYSSRDLLPGRYTFAIRPVGAGGDALAAGRYRIVVRATGTDGGEARTSLPLRVR